MARILNSASITVDDANKIFRGHCIIARAPLATAMPGDIVDIFNLTTNLLVSPWQFFCATDEGGVNFAVSRELEDGIYVGQLRTSVQKGRIRETTVAASFNNLDTSLDMAVYAWAGAAAGIQTAANSRYLDVGSPDRYEAYKYAFITQHAETDSLVQALVVRSAKLGGDEISKVMGNEASMFAYNLLCDADLTQLPDANIFRFFETS